MDDKTHLVSIITNLFTKYENNENILNKMINTIENLEKSLDNYNNQITQKNAKYEELSNDQFSIIKKFTTDKNRNYFYLQNKNVFFLYEDNEFKIITYNDLVMDIYYLINISNNKDLQKSKYTIENKIIKEIKNKSILNVIPNSKTIQNTLKLFYPSIFESKELTKYFLIIIGDSILKKNNNLTFLINDKYNQIINNIKNNIYANFGIEILNNIKNKTSVKDVDNNRFIKFKNDDLNINIENIINIFVLSCHYSVRYDNSEKFLNSMNKKYKSLIFKLTNIDDLINDFTNKCIKQAMNNKISSKNMYFIWSQYIDYFNYPLIENERKIINILQSKIKFDSGNFINVNSNCMNEILDFIKFVEDNCELNNNDEQIEIDELMEIYKDNVDNDFNYLNENNCISALLYFLPKCVVCDKKYINLKCNYWNKNNEIIEFIKKEDKQDISLYDLYEKYTKANYKYIANKLYFEYIYENV
jgi:hypothetical protein